jgi:hypothetical protein
MKTACSRIIGAAFALSVFCVMVPSASAQSNMRAQQRIQAEETRRQNEAYDKMMRDAAKEQEEWSARLTQQMTESMERNARMQGVQPGSSGKAVVVKRLVARPQPAAVFRPAPLQPPPGLRGQALANWVNARAAAKLQAAGFRRR